MKGGLYYLVVYLFISISSIEPLDLSVTGAFRGARCRGLVAGLQIGAGQSGVRVPWGMIAVAALWPLGQLTFTCDEGVNVIFIIAQ